MQLMIFLILPIVVGGMILAPKIINFVYDLSYFPSILAFQILLIMAAFYYISNPFFHALIISNQQKKVFWATFFGAVINVILNLILIPKYSLYGAAISTVISFIFVFSLLFWFTSRFTFIKPLNFKLLLNFIKISLSSIAMYLVVSQPIIYNLNVIFSVLVGVLVYLVSLIFIKKLTTLFKLNL